MRVCVALLVVLVGCRPDPELTAARHAAGQVIQRIASELVPGSKVTVEGDALVFATKEGACDLDGLLVLRNYFAHVDPRVLALFPTIRCADSDFGTAPENKNAAVDLTEDKIRRYLTEAYPKWMADHPREVAANAPALPCPEKLADLNKYMRHWTALLDGSKERADDVWRQPLVLWCGANLPPDMKGVAVISIGKDGIKGTADDIKAWACAGDGKVQWDVPCW